MFNRMHTAALAPFPGLRSEIDRMFDGFVERRTPAHPAVTIWEREADYVLEAEVPGLTATDLDVRVTGKVVTLAGARKVADLENAKVLRREWRGYEFERSFELPVDLDGGSVQAELTNGVLHVTLPKVPRHTPRKIDVKAAER